MVSGGMVKVNGGGERVLGKGFRTHLKIDDSDNLRENDELKLFKTNSEGFAGSLPPLNQATRGSGD